MLLLKTIFPSLHFGHSFSTMPFAISFASFPASPSTCFDLHFGFMQNSWGIFPLFLARTFGKLHVSHDFCAGFIKAFDGKEKVVLHSGYLLHAAKAPYFPFLR